MKEPQQEQNETLLLTADKVARMLQISKRSLWRLLSAGQFIQPLKLGRSVRWRADELKQWIANGCPAVMRKDKKGRQHG